MKPIESEKAPVEPLAVRRATAALMLDCSPTTIHVLIHAGKLETVLIGSDQRITVESIRRLATAKAPAPA